MKQEPRVPRIDGGELGSAEMILNGQPRVTNMNQDTARRNNVSPPSRMMNGHVGEAQNPTETMINAISFQPHAGGSESAQFTASSNQRSVPRSESKRLSAKRSPSVETGKDVADEHTPNIVIFGEAGVGKSSVVNLIAGEERATISNDALGCTFQYRRHVVTLNGIQFALWDTTGLDEGTEGMVPARLAENNLRTLMGRLARSGGIHLVIYCIRGTRLTKALKRNYDLFYVTVCRRMVPVALVVTGLEHQQGDMETWWDENAAALAHFGMWFDAHECVTTLDVDDALIQRRRSDSQRRLCELVVGFAGHPPWKIEPSLWALVLLKFRHLLRGVSNMGRGTTWKVMVYDGTASCQTHTRRIGDRQIEYEYIGAPLTPSTSCNLAGAHAGVLIFYTSVLPATATGIAPNDIATLRTVAGGKTCPVIVVLRGCTDDRVARQRWDAVTARHEDIQAYHVVDTQAALDLLTEHLYMEPVDEGKFSRFRSACVAVVQFCSDLALGLIRT